MPEAGLVEGSDGDLYGTTSFGGANLYYGTVFKITTTGTLTTLYSFCAQTICADGALPVAGLIQATDGNFYGTTYQGGVLEPCLNGCGTAFKMTPTGALTTLHSFHGTDGDTLTAGLTQATSGIFYGTTVVGGSYSSCPPHYGCGTVFGLSVGLGPFVELLPSAAKVGAHVKILGNKLTGATSVTFNGTPATFTVASPSLITTTVPPGATTGTVQVVTPGGTLSSNVPFRVIP